METYKVWIRLHHTLLPTDDLLETQINIRAGTEYSQWPIRLFFSSVQFSLSVVSDSLWPHESQHTRPPCLSPTPRVYSNSCPSSQWCHLTISSSVGPFSSCPQSLQASGSFPMSQLFAWGGQSIGVSASASVLTVNTRTDLLKDGLVGSPCSPRVSQESCPTPQFKSINFSVLKTLLNLPNSSFQTSHVSAC